MAYADYSSTSNFYPGSGGGGFLPDEQPQNASMTQTAEKNTRATDKQALRPVTIKQLLEAVQEFPDAPFLVDGRELTQVTVVAEIISRSEQSTNFNFLVDDGTGQIDVKYWIDQEESELAARERAGWREHVYVRVFGQVRSYQGKRSMVAFNIRPIEDFNEISYHMLEAIQVHLHTTKGGAHQGPFKGISASQSQAPAIRAFESGGSIVQDIMRVFDEAGSPESGLSIGDVTKAMGGRYPQDQVRKAIETLSEDGQMYSTIDDDHFARSAT